MSRPPDPILAFLPVAWAEVPAPMQRVLAQLAKTRTVFVLDLPERARPGERERWDLVPAAHDLLLCRPRLANPAAFAGSPAQQRMVRALLHWLDVGAFVAWVYSPAMASWARAFSPSLVIQDRTLEPRLPLAPPNAEIVATP